MVDWRLKYNKNRVEIAHWYVVSGFLRFLFPVSLRAPNKELLSSSDKERYSEIWESLR